MAKVEVVSAFLWKCFISANKSTKKVSMVTQLVNMRRRTQPPFSDNCFGNWVWMATATSKYDDKNDQLEANLVRKLRESISSIDNEVVMRMHGDDGLSGYCKNVDEGWGDYNKEIAEIFTVSSSCGFDLYKFDFGWGTPIWLNNCGLGGNDSESPYMNSVWLIDSKKSGGIEAWLTLEEQYMKAFDDIEELRVLASVDPDPFDI